jgi:Arc/MetJ family transcription regulator
MKRTSLFLDQALLKQVMRALGVKTYSAAVNASLMEILRIKRVQALPNFFGKGLWEGDLSTMRRNRQPGKARTSSRRHQIKK